MTAPRRTRPCTRGRNWKWARGEERTIEKRKELVECTFVVISPWILVVDKVKLKIGFNPLKRVKLTVRKKSVLTYANSVKLDIMTLSANVKRWQFARKILHTSILIELNCFDSKRIKTNLHARAKSLTFRQHGTYSEMSKGNICLFWVNFTQNWQMSPLLYFPE